MGKLTLGGGGSPIRPLHGVGQPPRYGAVDTSLFHYLTEAGIPYSRLHDVGGNFAGNLFVDIPNIFRDFDADPGDPASYDFAFTDILIKGLCDNGVEPFFRLGVSIENYHMVKTYRIFPPKDFLKWAMICEGVIKHYTRGWAAGYYYKIDYWEIWNEPDNDMPGADNQMWKGTKEEFFDLYGVASKYLKERFPELHIGGFASCGFYGISDRSPRMQYFITFFREFLDYVKKNGCPLDFFSWHTYGDAEDAVRHANFCREELDARGFGKVEDILNEWNPPGRKQFRATERDAANVAAVMCALQTRTRVAKAMYYDARLGTSEYGGMFHPMTALPLPTYYVFKAWNELYKLGTGTEVTTDACGVYAAAASDEACAAVLVANASDGAAALELEGFGDVSAYSVWRYDSDGVLSPTDEKLSGTLALPAHSLALLKK